MKNEIDDLLNNLFGSRTLRQSPLSAEEENKPELVLESDPVPAKTRAQIQREKLLQKHGHAAKRTAPAKPQEPSDHLYNAMRNQKELDDIIARQRREIESLSQNALTDIRRIETELDSPAVQDLASPPARKAACAPDTFSQLSAEQFSGLADVLSKSILGQEHYLKSLVIALKRPVVMGADRAAFFVTGPEDTGRHMSLSAAAQELCRRNVFKSKEISWIDLSLYPTAGEEKLFLQDLYAALAGSNTMLIFEHYEQCHPAFLTVLASLVMTGRSPLAGRYVLQNGRLIEAGTALVTNAVGALEVKDKYLIFMSKRPASKLADCFGAPFVTALGDLCETEPIGKDALREIASRELAEISEQAKKSLGLSLSACEEVLALACESGGHSDKGAGSVLSFFERIYRALAQYCLENDDVPANAALCAENGVLTVRFGEGETRVLDSLLPRAYQGELEAVKSELSRIVGLDEIKEYILSLEGHYAVQKRRRDAGLKTARVSMHMIFTGNPGTGKTTIARLVSRYLKAIGVLSGGQLVEVTRADLVGRYVGHTAPLTTQVIQSALGGVLFIDEAYSLYRGKDDSFGLEAIDTLVKGMEDHRDDLIVILAGYSKEMADFLTANSGLKSRFPNIIEFPDYTAEELFKIAEIQASNKGYRLDDACREPLLSYFERVQSVRARDAGNGRLARNKIEEAVLNQAKRLAVETNADLSLLLAGDFELEE